MPDPFDPAEFDAPPPSDPGADYRTLLDAMRKAGAEGVAQQVAALSRQIEQDARQRAEWTAQAGAGVDALHRAAGELQRISAGVWWDRLKEWITAALIGLGLIFAAALALDPMLDPRQRAAPSSAAGRGHPLRLRRGRLRRGPGDRRRFYRPDFKPQ